MAGYWLSSIFVFMDQDGAEANHLTKKRSEANIQLF